VREKPVSENSMGRHQGDVAPADER